MLDIEKGEAEPFLTGFGFNSEPQSISEIWFNESCPTQLAEPSQPGDRITLPAGVSRLVSDQFAAA